MLRLFIALVLFVAAASAGPNENDQVDKALHALIEKTNGISAPDHSLAFNKDTGSLKTRFAIYFLSGSSRLDAAVRTGDARLEADGKTISFRGTLDATVAYNSKLVAGQSTLLSGKASVSWGNAIRAKISVDDCKVGVGDLSLSTTKFLVDIESPEEIIKSATVRPPVLNQFEKALEPHLKKYVMKSLNGLVIC